ncbi:MAG: nitroreductase [Parcubacteria group bacterium CG1_02_39_15]|uniref:Nitroreductase n=4 Tax=Bacteria candidate phyla TaxID=1783234 RepID=A0A2G9YSF8_9BACT|nr:MAG: nitroreductase [Parcubacteria group bacterium CG1_02_39_15]PIP22167.1 MAG: nitroreductase [Candidatus Nealsonbacteria bacterium CG23_combo_of_CG06-09_8_20_14_all_39_25]PIQ98315.1 MAG: nitroreductase [Candidatus Nealsonbacteria bacterium CG11_big_fil_rev_8_21_14_0_20_39_9]PIZ88305.1 MAG: nitroreductase [Candidatus Nealsonbacteria bacterium CG_4_10_14_0_2_um_filter_39_15]PJC68337.1 MAG: nitroreductase [candidate division WWE3 bacterium CG_4_8_14_3_um_filter_42_11]
MNVAEAIKNRYSCRSYKADSVPEEKLKRVLEAARLAPSAHNEQECKFVVVRDDNKRREVAEAAGQGFIAEAPVIIAAVALEPEHIMRSGNPAYAIDLAIAVDHMTLQATEEGLGTCWIGAFSQEEVKKVLEVPEEYKVVALMPLGFPAEKGRPKSRKSLDEIISYDKF